MLFIAMTGRRSGGVEGFRREVLASLAGELDQRRVPVTDRVASTVPRGA